MINLTFELFFIHQFQSVLKNIPKMLRVLLLAVLMVHYSQSHTYHTGQCPQVQAMPEFDMKRVSTLILTFLIAF